MTCKRSAVGAAVLADRLYVCGGYDGITSLNTVQCYDPDRDCWTCITPMMKHRSAAGVVAFDGHIYALGGHDGLSIFDSVEKYDPQTGVWSPGPTMISKRCRFFSVFIHHLFVHSKTNNTVSDLDWEWQFWTVNCTLVEATTGLLSFARLKCMTLGLQSGRTLHRCM